MVNGFKTILCAETAASVLFVYSLVRLAIPMKKNTHLCIQIPVHLLRIIITLIATILMLFGLIICACYFEFVTFLAKCHFGTTYHDNLHGADAVWTYNTPECKSIVHILQLLQDVPETPQKMYETLREPKLLDTILKNHKILSCLRKPFLGYTFLIKFTPDYDQIIRYLEDYNNLEQFNEIINKATERDLPYDGEYMFEILVGRKAVEIQNGKLNYPVLVRFHHSVADGMGLATLLLTSFIKNGVEIFMKQCVKYNAIFDKLQKPTMFINKLLNIITKDVYCHFDMIYSKEQPNTLRRKLTGEKLVAYSLELPDEKLIQKIKTIKNVLNITFGDVILGAVSTSLSDYYQTHECRPPTEITSMNPVYLHPDKLENMLFLNTDGEPVTKLGNKLGVGLIELPINYNLTKQPSTLLSKVNLTTTNVRNSVDIPLTHWIFKVPTTIVPRCLITFAASQFHGSVAVTNMPGISRHTFSNDCAVDDMIVWANNFQQTGLTFTFFTYDNQLRVSATVDTGLISDVKAAQGLVDGVLRHIRMFYEDICNQTN